jgi:putative ABC transport system substrate-binding protein
MRRREFITLLGGAAAASPLAARAQPRERLPRIGYLGLTSAAQHAYGGSDAFLAGLSDLGYIEGRNIRVEFRFAEGDEDRLPGLATELVGLNVDVIVTYATGVFAARRATATIPIVFAAAADVVAIGLVSSLAHPDGNVTGLTFFNPELMAKRLELLKEVVPSLTRAGVLLLRGHPSRPSVIEAIEVTAGALKVDLQLIELREPREFETDFFAATSKMGGFVMVDHAQFLSRAHRIAALAARHRLPSIGSLELPASGGLMGYGVNFSDMFRRAAAFVDKIIRGAKPADIPIEQATKFKFVLNLKTAKALGIDFAPMLLARADEVIE